MLNGGTLSKVTFGVWALAFHERSTFNSSKPNCPDSKRAYPTLALNYPTLLRHSGGSAPWGMGLYPRKDIVVPLTCRDAVQVLQDCRSLMGHPAGPAGLTTLGSWE